MKKIFLMAIAAAAVMFTSCSKEENGGGSGADNARLTIKISNPAGTRAVEAPSTAVTATVDVSKSVVLVATKIGAIKASADLAEAAKTNPGQTIAGVPAEGQVFVAANLPDAAAVAAVKACLTIDAVKAYVISLANAGTPTTAVLSNVSKVEYTADVDTKLATANVSISPAMARLELESVGLKAGSVIKSFDVTGIYLDNVQPSFTLGGEGSGTALNIGQTIANANISYYKDDAATWSGTPTTAAAPASSNVWAYQIPAATTAPSLIIRITNVKIGTGTSAADFLDNNDGSKVYYLTAKSTTAVARAYIYQIAAGAGIEFDESNIHETPNPDLAGASINVEITPIAWTIGNLDYSLE